MTRRPYRTAVLIPLTFLLLTQLLTAAPEGLMSRAVHVWLAPIWLDSAEPSRIITPFTRTALSRSDDTEPMMKLRRL